MVEKDTHIFGKYQLIKKIATGGMAELYRAKIVGEQGFEKIVAIKRILPHLSTQESLVNSFIDEARLAAMLQHQNIVQIYDFGKMAEDYFIAMEYLDGRDLRDVIEKAKEKNTTIDLDTALYIVSRVCDGLDYAHSIKDSQGKPLNIVHRDISPQNIFITYSGQVKIIDFGIAKAASHNQTTQPGILKGKAAYMAPEHAFGKNIDHRIDIYAAGIILYEMLANKPMFDGENLMHTLECVVTGRFEKPEDAIPNQPSQLYEILYRSLDGEVEKRYQNAREMLSDIENCLSHFSLYPSSRKLSCFLQTLYKNDDQDNDGINDIPNGRYIEALSDKPGYDILPDNDQFITPESNHVKTIRDAEKEETSAQKEGKKKRKKVLLCTVIAIIILLLLFLPVKSLLIYLGLLSATKYTTYNIWVNKSLRMVSMNYKNNSAFIPAGTKVKDISADLVDNRIQFVTKKDKKRYTISFKPKHHKGKTVSDYAEMMFTKKDFGELIEGMTEEEKHAIKKGILEKGMSKRAIIVSYGYPPESHTQSLDDNIWTYYIGFFKRKQICFDENDRLKGKCEKE